MRYEKENILEAIKNAVVGYAVLLLSFAVFCIILWAVIVVVRTIVG